MRYVIQGLGILLILELAIATGWSFSRMRQAGPLLPPRQSMDADTWIDLQDLSTRILRTGSSQHWLDLADALTGKGFYTHAEIAYRRAFSLDPKLMNALEGIAFCEDRTGRITESDETYRRLLPTTTGETRQRILYALGRNALRREEADKAEDLFRENIDFIPARYMICKLLVDSGRVQEARPLIESFLKTLPRSLHYRRLQYRVALEHQEMDQAAQAAEAVERSLLLFPVNLQADFITERNERYGFRHLFAEYQKYVDYLTPEQKQATLLDLRDHLQGELSPYSILITKLTAEAAVHNRDPAVLQQALDQLREWGVRDATTLERQGDAHELAGNQNLAASEWEKSVSMTPTVELHRKLAKYYLSIENQELFEVHQSQEFLLEAENAYHDDEPDRSLELINQSLALNEKDAWSWYLLGKVQQAKQDFPAAKRAYQEYISLSPTYLRQN